MSFNAIIALFPNGKKSVRGEKNENILEREKYYIQKFYKENSEKSLNIMCTANLNPEQLQFEEAKE